MGRFLKKLKLELPYNPAVPLLDIDSKECKHIIETPAYPCLMQHYLQQPSYGISLGAHQQMNIYIYIYIYNMNIYIYI
jgi:hypothetical protein